MENTALISGRDTLLIAIPFLVLLLVSVFRLDQIIAAPKERVIRRQFGCGWDASGAQILRDPDGHFAPTRRKSGRPTGQRQQRIEG